jgi:hypothetical protein
VVRAKVKAADVNWSEYFEGIKQQCPWSLAAWRQGEITVSKWTGSSQPLNNLQARIYLTKTLNQRRLKKLCKTLDHGSDEWLWSYPGLGPYATPVAVLIQQNRARLSELRQKSKEPS